MTENPDDVMRRFLPDMKRTLNIEDLILYLLSENAICDDDPPKLTVSGQLSKPQVILNLQQIIANRGTIEQFLQALKRSSEDHAGHKELYDAMVNERQRRTSVSSQRTLTSRLNSMTGQSQLIPESSAQADAPPSEEISPTIVVAESGTSTAHSTGAPPNDGRDETATNISQSGTTTCTSGTMNREEINLIFKREKVGSNQNCYT